MMMIKLRSKRFSRSNSKVSGVPATPATTVAATEIKWELRPGGMLVQKRECKENEEETIIVRVSTVTKWHDISILSTSTFGKSIILC